MMKTHIQNEVILFRIKIHTGKTYLKEIANARRGEKKEDKPNVCC